jgi:16S rRNA A1518/A1519 N6-dimethyltransferase RsmA/KsgA/DIM1 with predicted DNA glycosylase/AP lyase activity
LKLTHPAKFDYIVGDALDQKIIFKMIQEKIQEQTFSMVHIVGNLPFKISGELLSIWNQQSLSKDGFFGLTDQVEMSLILSKNMGEKLLPTFNKRTRFSTMTQTAFDVHQAGIYPRTAFNPVPTCDAIGLKFLNRKERLFGNEVQVQYYINFLKKIYNLPNKTMANACSKIPEAKDCFEKLGIAPSDRVFMVPIHTLVQLSQVLCASQSKT